MGAINEVELAVKYLKSLYLLFFSKMVTPLLRVCPKTSGGITKFSEHEAD